MKAKRTRAQIKADARRTGRPPKPRGKKQSEMIGVYVTPVERKRLDAEAKRLGVSLSALLMRPWRKGD